MSTRGTYLDGDRVCLDDAWGHHTRIPVSRVGELLGRAKKNDSGRVTWALRPFDRDVLQGAYDLLPVCDQCHEEPAFEDMGDGNKFCPACCSAAAGSRYDDRTED